MLDYAYIKTIKILRSTFRQTALMTAIYTDLICLIVAYSKHLRVRLVKIRQNLLIIQQISHSG